MAKSSVKFRDSIASFERLSADIASRKYASIYLLMGDESYFIDALCEQLSTTILTPEQQAFNQLTLYGKDSDVGQVVNCCRQMPMMGEREVVILKEAQQLRSIEKLSVYSTAPSPSTILDICHKEKSVDKRSQFYKSIAAKGVVFESVRPRDYEIGSWLNDYVRKRGLSIQPKALAMLTDNLGTDISKISNELSKLMLSLPEGASVITDEHIEQNIGISKDFNNFELCRAVVNRDMARALFIADNFSKNPKNNPLLLTISALFSQFKQLFLLNYLMWQSRTQRTPMPADQELMRVLKINNFYAINDLKGVVGRWPNKSVFYILGQLREYDAKSKGMNSGGASDGELLRELILHIFSA